MNVENREPTKEDHRVRVAREKRERMRGHLLQSVLAVYSASSAGGPTVIDDVVRHAGVSRGTFYKYFDTLDQAVEVLAAQLADEMTVGIYAVYDVLEDPLLRTATGFQTFLLRAVIEPDWGAFISHIGLLGGENLFLHHVVEDIRRGLETGDYSVRSVDVAADLIIGAQSEAIRRIIAERPGTAYVRLMAEMVLRSLGVSASKAEKVVGIAFERLCTEAPGRIAWWRQPD